MDWIKFGTLVISFFTLLLSIYSVRTLNQNKEKDRKVTVSLPEKRRMQKDLMDHITKVLDLGRKCFEETDENEKKKIKFELLNHKVYIWINLNEENSFAKELRSHSTEYIFWCASFLDSPNEKEKFNFRTDSYKNQRSIM
ncbi:hypothetical protein ORM92_21420 [Bacillus cereus]|uniref:hypothetical protein n=1 Tax=Bacillus TaxID=1386 RepID=UPI000C28C2ED|nr:MULTISPECIES: hypothetical protein [Bacillus]MBK0076786.1 hypothetical protein [Bacillus sp. S56]MCE9755207.1 hypothetical protein [Bacillus cereus]MDZ4408836.1 hypothetical protein [Bacillus cereus]MDZ4533653.1 hypothetical protein [Bacillus cereus]RJE15392.1 hypothetical protein C0U42_05715 [Bacillus cereus]